MNIEYVKKDSEALIIDETNNDKIIKYYDNLDKVLAKENLVENMEEREKSLNLEITHFKQFLRKSIKSTITIQLMFMLAPLIIFPVANCFDISSYVNLLNAIIDGFIAGALFLPGMTIGGAIINLLIIYDNNNTKKEISAREAELRYLSKEIIKNKEEIEELKKDLTNTDTSTEIKIVKVEDRELLKELRDKIKFYYNVGYKQKKYNRYYKNGELEKNVPKEELETVKEILEEKGPILVKKQK